MHNSQLSEVLLYSSVTAEDLDFVDFRPMAAWLPCAGQAVQYIFVYGTKTALHVPNNNHKKKQRDLCGV